MAVTRSSSPIIYGYISLYRTAAYFGPRSSMENLGDTFIKRRVTMPERAPNLSTFLHHKAGGYRLA